MKNKKNLFLALTLLAVSFLPSFAEAGNVKKKYINLTKDGEQATATDLGNIAASYGQIQTMLSNLAYSFTTTPVHGLLKNGIQLEKDGAVFNGVNTYVELGDPTALKNLSKVTVEAWVNYAAYGGGGQSYSVIAVKGTPWTFLLENPYNKVRFRTTINGVDTSISDPNAHELNKWYHFAGSYDGTNLKVYRDGVLAASKAVSGSLASNSVTAKLGTYEGSNYNFNGKMREVRIWNVARTDQEIKENIDKVMKGTEPGLVGYWKFN